jgi:molecular chaperone GrpE
MPDERDKGANAADIPERAIAEALAAVERRGAARNPAPPPAAASGGELERLRAELELSQEHGRKVFEQLKDEHELRLRGAADLDNYKKRAAKERDEVLRYGIERLVKEILPVLDSLDRALAAAARDEPLVSGVVMTRRMLEDALGRFGVKAFSAAGHPFDPRVHEALMTVATGDHPPHVVIEEQQRGYFLHDRLIRPAAVVVSAAPAPAAGADGAPTTEP